MKLAVLSDIHGNVPALEAVIEDIERFEPDAVIVNGDVVNRGPRSLDAWSLVCAQRASAGWQVLRGNHEDYVLASLPDTAADTYSVTRRMSSFSARQLGAQVRALAELPDGASLALDAGAELRIRHASMRSNTDGIDPDDPLDKLRTQIAPAPAYFVTGHTHRAYVLHVDDTQLINAGSVGAPADGDPRASYVRLCQRAGSLLVEQRRVSYDRARAERDFRDAAWLEGAGPLAALLYVEWHEARPILTEWMNRCLKPVMEGQLDLAVSVADTMLSLGHDPRLVFPAPDLSTTG